MALTPGTRIGSYEVLASIGKGGMGEVWKARDTKLGRDVAIKVLPDAFARDADRVARFEREARTLASLNHSNIAGIYGLEEADPSTGSGQASTIALVMELVDGPTLAERLALGSGRSAVGLPLGDALPIAKQIADALEAAHERGIIHRDLKPANIKIRPDGTVKVLDFGLAKAFEASGKGEQSMSPTLTSPAQTLQGVVLGTAAYMSPEQAEGRDVDQRTDIWSFGVVLYEMLTGRRLFEGDSVQRVMARVLERDVDLTALPPATPSSIRRLLRRCLERDPKRRLHHIADARVEIDEAISGRHDEGTAPPPTLPRRSVGLLTWGLGALVLVLAVVAAWPMMRPEAGAPKRVVRSVVPVESQFGVTAVRDLAVSPQGTRMVYAGSGGLRVRELDQVEAVNLRGAEGGVSPIFSPDGESVLFFAFNERSLKRVPVRGGPSTRVALTGDTPRGVAWAPDDTIVFATSSSRGLLRVPVTGGEPQHLTTVDEKSGEQHLWPSALPNGKGVLFALCRQTPECSLAVVSLTTGEVTDLHQGGSHPQYSITGHVVYAADGALRAVGFDQERLSITARNAVPVVDRVQVKGSGAANFDLAANGLLAYSPDGATEPRRTLVWMDRTGRESPLAFEPRNYLWVRVSPNGARITATISDGGRPSDIWVSDVGRPALTRVTTGPNGKAFPMWAPDGQRVAFASNGAVFWTLADGSGEPQQLFSVKGSTFASPEGWADKGRALVFTYGTVVEPHIGLLSMEGERKWKPLIERASDASMLSISPDGHWVAYQSDDTGQYEIYIERFPELGDRQRVSTEAGGWAPVWAPTGKEVFYRRLGDGAMMAAPLQTSPSLTIGAPVVLFANRGYEPLRSPQAGAAAGRGWDVGPDGRFLMIKADLSVSEGREIILVQNWFEELKRLAPAK